MSGRFGNVVLSRTQIRDIVGSEDAQSIRAIEKLINYANLQAEGVMIRPPSIGDYNISATDAVTDLNLQKHGPQGRVFMVSWYGGDGSHSHRFIGTNVRINGIDPMAFANGVNATSGYNWEGHGVSPVGLPLRVIGEDAGVWYFETFDVDIWDSDGGAFAGTINTWEKYINGKYTLIRSATITAYPTPIVFDIPFATAPAYISGFDISSANYNVIVQNLTTTGGNLYVYNVGTATQVTAGVVEALTIVGRWTIGWPRRK